MKEKAELRPAGARCNHLLGNAGHPTPCLVSAPLAVAREPERYDGAAGKKAAKKRKIGL